MVKSKKSFAKFSLWFFTDFRRNNTILYWFLICSLLIIVTFVIIGIVFFLVSIIPWIYSKIIYSKIRSTTDPVVDPPPENPEVYIPVVSQIDPILRSVQASYDRP